MKRMETEEVSHKTTTFSLNSPMQFSLYAAVVTKVTFWRSSVEQFLGV